LNNIDKIKVIICGIAGNMGSMTAKTITEQNDIILVGGTDVNHVEAEIEQIIPGLPLKFKITDNLDELIKTEKPDIMIDLTKGHAAPGNILTCLKNKIPCVVGTTGISDEHLDEINKISNTQNTPVFLIPNFSVGAVLMMKFAKEASGYFQTAEIIELHHNKKTDAPSGTAIRTAQLMKEARENFIAPVSEVEKLEGARGANSDNIRIHSVRLPGLLAHQKVIFGGTGETLTIHHDSLSRESFMPGIMLAIRKIKDLSGVVVGLENVL
jgi:4-hydroxy-tetrahydrodipicolinate reductase